MEIEPHFWSILEAFWESNCILNQFRSILEAFWNRSCIFEEFLKPFWEHFWIESVWFFQWLELELPSKISRNPLLNEVDWVSNGKQQVQFEREFVYSFVIEFNPKGDIMLFCCLWGCSSSRKKTIQSPTVAESCNSRVDLTIPSWQGKTFSIYLRDKRQFHLPSLCAVQYS